MAAAVCGQSRRGVHFLFASLRPIALGSRAMNTMSLHARRPSRHPAGLGGRLRGADAAGCPCWRAPSPGRTPRGSDELAAERERQHELDDKMAEIRALNAECRPPEDHGGGAEQSPVRARAHGGGAARQLRPPRRTGAGGRRQIDYENLAKLGERLAVIDAAQSNIPGLTQEVVSLKDILPTSRAAAPSARAGWKRSSATGCRRAPMNSSTHCRTASGPIA